MINARRMHVRESESDMTTTRIRRAVRAGMTAAIGLIGGESTAVEPWRPTDLEMTRLPQYCAVRFNAPAGSAEYKQWRQTLGPDFLHVHHYCAALNFMTRYYRSRNERDRNYNLQNAQSNFGHTIRSTNPTFQLLPEAYLNRGITFSLQKKYAQAFPDMYKAVQLNAQLVRGYNELATLYLNINERSKALEIVTVGLQHNPGSKSLQARYTELGGKLPYPEPAKPAKADAPKIDDAASSRSPAQETVPAEAAREAKGE